ncbi:MAG: flagellar hook-basal body complex protein FliE [Alphaproteobacteria bacterium]|nr:flagellar hook-basal body complex protein FliE [Alphaproteobacteria bacterium]
MIDAVGQIARTTALDPAGASAATGATTSGAGFEEALTSALSDISGQLKHAETVSISGVKGEASQLEVVTAVMDAEQKLQAAIAVRDRVVQAYLEISRMQI